MRPFQAIATVVALLAGPLGFAQDLKPALEPQQPAAAVTEGPAESRLTKADAEAWLDGLMAYALPRGDIAGGVVVIVKNGEILLQKGYGYSDVAKHAPVDPERTLFRPGSVSKLFTWTALMQRVEGCKLKREGDENQ